MRFLELVPFTMRVELLRLKCLPAWLMRTPSIAGMRLPPKSDKRRATLPKKGKEPCYRARFATGKLPTYIPYSPL